MDIVCIRDAEDERLDVYARLTEHQLRSKLRRDKATMIAESRIVIEVALKEGMEPLSLLMDERHVEAMRPTLEGLPAGVPVYVAPREVLSQIVGFKVTRGIMAAMRRPDPVPVAQVARGARRLAVLDGLVDATNVGAIFRSAAALGVDGVLLSPTCADPLSRRAARVSMGTVFQVPWATFGARGEELAWPGEALAFLHEEGFCVAAMALVDGARPLDDPTLLAHEKLALVFGTEGWGLSPEALVACDEAVVIPMAHGVDSLNVAASSAVAFWQLCR